MAQEPDLFDEVDLSTVISKPGGTPDPVSGVQPPPEGSGIRLGRYTTLRLLGKGGMAEVYLATQDGPAGFAKTCVVKRMRRALAVEQRFVDMFLREARVAARLNHANVVQIFELGEEAGEYFIAMEFLDGISLHRAARRCWANETSMPMEVVLRAIADSALGLHHAHTLRDRDGNLSPLIHRDISPDNLVVTRDGVTKVLDFGIAKTGDDDGDAVTRTGELKGKIPYMSPEQIRGDQLDGRSDLWAVGVTLYWLLTGKRPFDGGSDHMTIDRILRSEPVPPRELNPLIPAGLQQLILQLLEKDVDKRMPTGAILHDRLSALLGPSSGTSNASSFANLVLAMPALEKNITPGSVLTIIAARPETQWLKRVSEAGEGFQLESLVPEHTPSGGVLDLRARLPNPPSPDPDTAGTVSGISTESLVARMGAGPSRTMPIAAGLVGAVLLAGLGIFVLSPGDDAEAPSLAQEVAAASAVAPRDDAAPSTTDLPPGPPDDEATNEQATQTQPEKQAQTQSEKQPEKQPEKQAQTQPEKQTEKQTEKRSSPRKRSSSSSDGAKASVKTKAPGSVVWKLRGKTVGRGADTLKVPVGTSALVAVDSVTGGTSEVKVEGGVADYASLGRGTLDLRVRPWAKVSIGGRDVGTTPVAPVKLAAGRYKVTLVWKDKTKTETVTISGGRQSSLKVDMRD